MKDHEHDWSEPSWAVYCSDPTCDVTLEAYLAKLHAENAALREIARAVANRPTSLSGTGNYWRYCDDCDGTEAHTDECPVTRARALLAQNAPTTR